MISGPGGPIQIDPGGGGDSQSPSEEIDEQQQVDDDAIDDSLEPVDGADSGSSSGQSGSTRSPPPVTGSPDNDSDHSAPSVTSSSSDGSQDAADELVLEDVGYRVTGSSLVVEADVVNESGQARLAGLELLLNGESIAETQQTVPAGATQTMTLSALLQNVRGAVLGGPYGGGSVSITVRPAAGEFAGGSVRAGSAHIPGVEHDVPEWAQDDGDTTAHDGTGVMDPNDAGETEGQTGGPGTPPAPSTGSGGGSSGSSSTSDDLPFNPLLGLVALVAAGVLVS